MDDAEFDIDTAEAELSGVEILTSLAIIRIGDEVRGKIDRGRARGASRVSSSAVREHGAAHARPGRHLGASSKMDGQSWRRAKQGVEYPLQLEAGSVDRRHLHGALPCGFVAGAVLTTGGGDRYRG